MPFSLREPVWPLARTILFLSLAAPDEPLDLLIGSLPGDLEVGSITYSRPGQKLIPFADLFQEFQRLDEATDHNSRPDISAPNGEQLDPMESALMWIKQHIIERELEAINSSLCGPEGCTLCCTGPGPENQHLFFEIPLQHNELRLFPTLERYTSVESRSKTPYDYEDLLLHSVPFYGLGPILVEWKYGWSMILGKGTACPHLGEGGRCAVYPSRPQVCRRPQIFSYIVEEKVGSRYQASNTILAVLDCPYVQKKREEIENYARLCEADLVFKHNKL